ncbi:RPAP3-like protein [Mya arenaria]|uniref:RNA polymerase II-associated protein 3 n=1 Tax=Mya arenaria TaxID=6604 RepID=A0ABY7FS57_MYAAR|nr:RPAP3-like protein [Mya arenaria]
MSKISASEEKMLNLQYQMKQNNQDLQSFMQDLDSWESEIKIKEEKLKEKKNTQDSALPPVRNSLDKKKLKKKVKKKKDDVAAGGKRISGYDYRSWDKFDVDKACESVSSSEESYETDEEWETERKKQAAVLEKDKGNEHFKKGQFDAAIECYTRGADLDPTNPLLPANRAMAMLKQDKFAAAELDCSIALTLDPLYTKAYLRRGTARLGLHKYIDAKADYERVLQLEPNNKKAKSDLELIEKELAKQKMVSHADEPVAGEVQTSKPVPSGIVRAITKPPGQRSKKPLVRIEIEEVGGEEDRSQSVAMANTLATQSQVKRDIMEKEAEEFQRFTTHGDTNGTVGFTSPGCITSPADIASPADIGRQNLNANNIDSDSVGKNGSKTGVSVTVVGENSGDTCTIAADKQLSQIKSDSQTRTVRTKPSGSSTVSSPRKLPQSVPTTSVQFQADFRQLKHDIEAFYQYFKNIPAMQYQKLFGTFFEADVLSTIVKVIHTCYVRDGVDCFPCLQCLTSVRRFSMVVLFMSSKEKQVFNLQSGEYFIFVLFLKLNFHIIFPIP